MSEFCQNLIISVVLVCHNDGRWLPRCLDSLRTQTMFDRMELIIADNASQDGTDKFAENCLANWPNSRFLATGGDNGFDVACNRAAEVSRGKYLYFLNPDTWLEPDCLEQLYLTTEREQASGAGSTILEYDDNTVQAKGSHGFDFAGNPLSPRGGRVPKRLFCVAGFIFIRRDIFFNIGKLDEKMFMYGEETDVAWRLWLSGGTLIAVPSACVHHRGAVLVNPDGGSRIIANRTSTQKRFLANRNCLIVIAKNCQHLLLFMLFPCVALVLVEWFVTLLMTRSWLAAKATTLDSLIDFWRLRGHVRQERRRIHALRCRSDFWMLRFFRVGFGRWSEVSKIFSRGFPKINR